MAPKKKVKCSVSKQLKSKNKLNNISESNSETESCSKQEPVLLRKSNIVSKFTAPQIHFKIKIISFKKAPFCVLEKSIKIFKSKRNQETLPNR